MADLTSKFQRVIRNIEGRPVSGLDVDLYQSATKKYDLTEDVELPGNYAAENVASGEYDIWINGSIYISGVFHAANKLFLVQQNFDDTGVKLNSSGLNAQMQVQINPVTSQPEYLGQLGTDDNGRLYVATDMAQDPHWKAAAECDESSLSSNAEGILSIKNGGVTEAKIGTGAVTEAKIGTGAVTTNKIAAEAVNSSKIEVGAITTNLLNDSAVTTIKITDLNVTTGKIADDAVTGAKLDPAIAGNGLSFREQNQTLEVSYETKVLKIASDKVDLKWKMMLMKVSLSSEGTSTVTMMHNSLNSTEYSITHISTGIFDFACNAADFTENKTNIIFTLITSQAVFVSVNRTALSEFRISLRNTSNALIDIDISGYIQLIVTD